jgi:hypothetical protein
MGTGLIIAIALFSLIIFAIISYTLWYFCCYRNRVVAPPAPDNEIYDITDSPSLSVSENNMDNITSAPNRVDSWQPGNRQIYQTAEPFEGEP